MTDEDQLWEVLERQELKCPGCNEPLTSIEASREDEDDNILEIESNEHEEPRMGFLRYKKARSLGGSRQQLEDMEFVCEDCVGTITRSFRLPKYLVAGVAEWLESHHEDPKNWLRRGPSYVRSFNHLARLAIERFISTEDGRPEPEAAEKAKSVANDVIKELDKMIIEIDEMRERLDRFTD